MICVGGEKNFKLVNLFFSSVSLITTDNMSVEPKFSLLKRVGAFCLESNQSDLCCLCLQFKDRSLVRKDQ